MGLGNKLMWKESVNVFVAPDSMDDSKISLTCSQLHPITEKSLYVSCMQNYKICGLPPFVLISTIVQCYLSLLWGRSFLSLVYLAS